MKSFADAAARYAYYVLPEDVRTEFKQEDTSEVYVAARQGAGAQAWELSYEVGSDGGGTSLTSPVLSVTISSDQHDWAPTGGGTAVLWRINPSGATRTITGIVSSFALNGDGTGRALTLVNTSSLNRLLIGQNTGDSALANRFLGAQDLAIEPGDGALIFYDVASSAWRVLSVMGSLQAAYTSGQTIALTSDGLEITHNDAAIIVVDVGADETTYSSPEGVEGSRAVAGTSNATVGGESDASTVRTGNGGVGGLGADDGAGATKHGADGGNSETLYLRSGSGGDGGEGGAATGVESVSGDGGDGGSSGDVDIDTGSPGSGAAAGPAIGGAAAGVAGTGGGTGAVLIGTSNASMISSGRAEGIQWTHAGPFVVDGTTSYLLFPRLTTAERNALSPSDGSVLYNTTTNKLQVRAGGAWVDLH
jgi:hypothetical protein